MTRNRRPRRRAAAMIVAIVAVAVVTLIGLSLVQSLLRWHRQARIYEQQAQALWLAEAALARSAARLRADPAYTGETWQPTAANADTAGGSDATPAILGRAVIRIEPVEGNPSARTVLVESLVPDDAWKRVRQTRRKTVLLKQAGENP